LGAIGRRPQVENRPVFDRFGKVPLATNRNLAFAVAVDVARGEADIVPLGKIAGDEVLLPAGILIPLDRLLVGEDDVGFAITIDIGQLESVTNVDLVDFNPAPLIGGRLCGHGDRDGEKEEQEKRGGFHWQGFQARRSRMTSPATSVSRKSRPLKR